jgi:hypothetical protein
MLYDPKWEVKADPFSLPHFIAWLERQPPERMYDFHNCTGGCLIGQYIASFPDGQYIASFPRVGYVVACLRLFGTDSLGKPNQDIAYEYPRTFGAALERARNLLSETYHG